MIHRSTITGCYEPSKHGWFMSALPTVYVLLMIQTIQTTNYSNSSQFVQCLESQRCALGFVDLNQTSAFPARLLCCLAFTWLGQCDGPENPDLRVDLGNMKKISGKHPYFTCFFS